VYTRFMNPASVDQSSHSWPLDIRIKPKNSSQEQSVSCQRDAEPPADPLDNTTASTNQKNNTQHPNPHLGSSSNLSPSFRPNHPPNFAFSPTLSFRSLPPLDHRRSGDGDDSLGGHVDSGYKIPFYHPCLHISESLADGFLLLLRRRRRGGDSP
jgi:hypothetical protein